MTWRRFARHRPALIGLAVVLAFALAALLAPWLTPYEPNTIDLEAMLQAPAVQHPLGTDELGRDLLTRIIYGGRVSLAVGFLAVLLSATIGTTIGALAGYYGGQVDNVLMRFVDFAISLPSLFVLIILASIYGSQPATIVLVIGGLRWMGTARLVRGSFLSLRERDFVLAARCLGAGPGRHHSASPPTEHHRPDHRRRIIGRGRCDPDRVQLEFSRIGNPSRRPPAGATCCATRRIRCSAGRGPPSFPAW